MFSQCRCLSVLVLQFSAVLMVCVLGLAGCGCFDAGQSGAVDVAPSVPVEKVMSGGYEVGPDGKLLNPNDVDDIKRPQIPVAMNKEDAAGAEAFAKYYLASFAYARRTGDVERLKEFTHPDCGWCEEKIRKIEEIYAQCGWIDTKDIAVEKTVEVLDFAPIGQDLWQVSMEVKAPALTVYDAKSLRKGQEKKFTMILQSKFTAKGWRMWEVEGESKK